MKARWIWRWASVMGRRASSPSREYRVAGIMLPSVVGMWPPHHAVQKEPAGQLGRVVCPNGLPQHYTWPHCLPRPGDGTSEEQERAYRPSLPETQLPNDALLPGGLRPVGG